MATSLRFPLSSKASQATLVIKNPTDNAGDMRHRFDPWVRNISWQKKGQPTPVFLPGTSHRQRRLVGYSPWGHKELDTTEHMAQIITIDMKIS